ncbi:MAG: hypothetical protein V1792_08265 [Pseudomonadota bacterium]
MSDNNEKVVTLSTLCPLVDAAKEVFGTTGGFDYADGAPGYAVVIKGSRELSKPTDWFGGFNPNGTWNPTDGIPDVNCAGLIFTPAKAIGCDPRDKPIDIRNAKRGDIFYFSLLKKEGTQTSVYWHVLFLDSDPIDFGNGDLGFRIYHSMQLGVGPTDSDFCIVRANKDVEIYRNCATIVTEFPSNQAQKPIGDVIPYKEATVDITGAKLGLVYHPDCCGTKTPPPPRPFTWYDAIFHYDPWIIDLDGDGIQTSGLDFGIRFDHDANGFKELTGWVGPGDGVLMLDINGNDRLDNGRELFSDYNVLPNGTLAGDAFQALSSYDANLDGVIDASDPTCPN